MESAKLNTGCPVVSVLCMAYNHEKYIRQCLDGFVMQKTEFPFEVLINDDASPDGTAKIIREYEEKYPDIIKPIYQNENQYSKRVNILDDILFPRAKGKYIALCEGDDCWVDSHKLQRQYDIMEKYPNCHLCCHNVLWVTCEGESRHCTCPKRQYETGLYGEDVFVSMVLKNFFHVNSMFVRYDDYKKYCRLRLKFKDIYARIRVGDASLYLYMSQLGDTYYFSDIMSYYRPWSAPGSFSSQQKDVSEMIFGKEICLEAIKAFDEYTRYRYHEACSASEQICEIKIAQFSKQYKKCLTICDRNTLKKVIPNFKSRMKIYVGAYFPKLVRWYDAKKERRNILK